MAPIDIATGPRAAARPAAATDTRRIVVTGATGFLGGAIARRLVATRPDARVLGIGRDRERGRALRADGVEWLALDLDDAAGVARAFEGADAVVHSAALSSPWGRRADFERANIDASEHVVAASIAAGAQRLVHVSTPGIYHDGRPHRGIAEDDPLPARAANHYADTKRIAEQRVLAHCERAGLPVLVLRPRAIFGPGDSAILPRIAQAMRQGRLRRLGDGRCTVDLTYVENVVDAALLALDAPATLSGRAYNITNGEPVAIWDVIDRLADALALPRPGKRAPLPLALAMSSVIENAYRLLRPGVEPPVLRYAVELLSVDMTLDIGRARDELGYRPRIGMDEALAITFADLARARP